MSTANDRSSLLFETRRKRQRELQPKLAAHYNASALLKPLSDSAYRLSYFAYARQSGEQLLHTAYVGWLKRLVVRQVAPWGAASHAIGPACVPGW
jgi:hypothetical protein